MRLSIGITSYNEALEGQPIEVARLLRHVAGLITLGMDGIHTLYDADGKTVGFWDYDPGNLTR